MKKDIQIILKRVEQNFLELFLFDLSTKLSCYGNHNMSAISSTTAKV